MEYFCLQQKKHDSVLSVNHVSKLNKYLLEESAQHLVQRPVRLLQQ